MKRLFAILLCCSLLLLVCACSNNAGKDELKKVENEVDGLWMVMSDSLISIVYFSDGKFYSELAEQSGELIDASKGAYEVDKGEILLSTSNFEGGYIYKFINDEFKLYFGEQEMTRVDDTEFIDYYKNKL